ncbi:MAG: SDR family oxidoreductase [Bacteroidales bacterium]|nr:SDR family oxidoreductase [Bacteroidales bacterium]
MKILFIGGTGNISSACTLDALKNGHEVYHFNRNKQKGEASENVITVTGDRNNIMELRQIDKFGPFDVITDFMCFTPDQMQTSIDCFAGKTSQYIFISSATVYKKPPDNYIITEDCPLENKFWKYAGDKIACEKLLTSQTKLTYTIVRPSYTYGKSWLPTGLSAREYNPIYRMRKELPIIVHGDGESLWVMTHNTDLASALTGLYGNAEAVNNHFHVTSDEVHTWNQLYAIIGKILGIEPKPVYIPSEFINRYEPEWGEGLLGDKCRSMVFDNSKIKSVVKNWGAVKTYEEGMRESIAWFEEKPERMQIDQELEAKYEYILKKYLA